MLRCTLDCKIKPPVISSVTLESSDTSYGIYAKELSINLSPPVTVDDKVEFNQQMMKIGEWYPFNYEDNKYLAVKTSDKTIEVYKIKR